MYIPIFYRVETINKEKLQDVLMGKISLHEAHELKAQMMNKRRKHLTILILCAAAFAFSAYLGLSYDKYMFDDGVMFVLLAGIFVPFFVSIFQFPGLAVSLQYLSALRRCRPGGRITFTAYRKYNLGKVDNQLLEKIAAYRFNADEATGIFNMADYDRAVYTRWAIFSCSLGAALAIFSVIAAPHIMAIRGETPDTLRFMVSFPRWMAAILALAAPIHLYRVRISKKYIRAIITTYTKEHMQEREKRINGMISEIMERTRLPSINLVAKREPVTVFSSKFGGTPYLPPGFQYPKGSGGKPLRLLAQLNFEELPQLPDFPQTGILQFYASDNGVYGADFEAPARQKDFRVIYHAEIVRDIASLAMPPYVGSGDEDFPFEGEFALRGEMARVPVTSSDFRFHKQVLPLYNAAFSTAASCLYDMPGDVRDRLFESCNGGGHRIGGYPFFTQTDPREDSADFSGHTVSLLQIDSDDAIIWGDCGVAHFFITPEKLQARDFSDVMYTWDCY